MGEPTVLQTTGLQSGPWTLFVPTASGEVFKLKANGALYAGRWPVQIGSGIAATPTLDLDGNLYVGDSDGRLHVLLPTGDELWAMDLDAPLAGGVLLKGAAIYGLTTAGTLYALERGGKSTGAVSGWHREGGNARGSSTSTNCEAVGRDPSWVGFVLAALGLRLFNCGGRRRRPERILQ